MEPEISPELTLEKLCTQIRNNAYQGRFLDFNQLPALHSEEDLISVLDALKTNTTIWGMEFPSIYSEDFDKPQSVVDAIDDLLNHNQTLVGLKGSINYLHKRICRDLNIQSKDGFITLSQINGDNASLINPEEFDYVTFPGGITRSVLGEKYIGEDEFYPSKAKIAAHDRSLLLTQAVSQTQNKPQLCQLMQYADVMQQSLWTEKPTLEEMVKATDEIFFQFFTRKFGFRQQLIRLDPEKAFAKCQRMPHLHYVLDTLGSIKGSLMQYSASMLKVSISVDKIDYDSLPRTYGFRAAVRRIKPPVPQIRPVMINPQPQKRAEYTAEDESMDEIEPNRKRRAGALKMVRFSVPETTESSESDEGERPTKRRRVVPRRSPRLNKQ